VCHGIMLECVMLGQQGMQWCDNSVFTLLSTITYSVVLSLNAQPLHPDTHYYHTVTWSVVLLLHTQPLHNDTLLSHHCILCCPINTHSTNSVSHGDMDECVMIGQQSM
jgi:hypothetical protein